MIMGRPPKYTKDEARKVQMQNWERWAKENYERLSIRVPQGFNERIAEAWKRKGYPSKRQFVIDSIEKNFGDDIDKQ